MKKIGLTTLFLSLFVFGFTIPGTEQKEKTFLPDDEFCKNLTQILTAGNTQFAELKGETTTKMISGVERPFYVSKTKLGTDKGFVNDSEEYPSYTEIFAISKVKGEVPEASLVQEFEKYKEKIKACFAAQPDWKLMEKDKTNDLYLEDTNFKKITGFQAKPGPKVKFELYMYNNRVEGHWCIEFNVEGVGK